MLHRIANRNNNDLIRAINGAADANEPWETQVRHAIGAWIEAAEKRPALMLAWIRDAPALGAEAARLHREFMTAFIEMLQGLCATAGIGPIPRQRAIMLLGGLNELLRVTLQEGGRCADITEETSPKRHHRRGRQCLRDPAGLTARRDNAPERRPGAF
jgi:hypothetical protein